MSDTPDPPTDPDDGTDPDGIAIDGPEAGFLDDRDPDDYPDVLRITSTSEAEHRRATLDRLERWEAGEEVPHVVNFEDPADLRSLLTDRRLELLRSVMADRPASIRGLADRLGRDVKTVHDDLQVLADYDVVHFERDGRAKRPFVPYETVEVSIEISASSRVDDPAPA